VDNRRRLLLVQTVDRQQIKDLEPVANGLTVQDQAGIVRQEHQRIQRGGLRYRNGLALAVDAANTDVGRRRASISIRRPSIFSCMPHRFRPYPFPSTKLRNNSIYYLLARSIHNRVKFQEQ
jgi:hypothetical protein